MSFSIGENVGPYRIVERLGIGVFTWMRPVLNPIKCTPERFN